MKLREALDDKKMDLRLRDRRLAEGKIQQEEVDTYRESLSDDEENYDLIDSRRDNSSNFEHPKHVSFNQ